MALSKPRTIFGIHSITPYSRQDELPYGILLVTGGGNLEMTAENETLTGGSSRYPWASQPTSVNTSLTANVKSFEGFLFELFLGAKLTQISASATGEIRAYTNVKGTSVQDPASGVVVQIKAASKADLKFGRYVIKATGTNKVKVYCHSDIDFSRGQSVNFKDDSLLISEEITVGTVAVEVPGFGIELVKGSGTLALTTGDTAAFTVFPENKGAQSLLIGSGTSNFPAFGARMFASKADNQIFEINAFNCQGAGLPLPLQEKAFAIADLTMTLLRDPARDAVAEITFIEEI